jgi:hypothetical protein
MFFPTSAITLGYLIAGYKTFFGNSDFAAAKFGNMSNRFDMI